ncbi:MAG: ABC transporter permease [Cyanobacteriota/Melainabacteria group bacterium]|nr:ABC transporter permease [Cyanobacteria bacterium HKST-UBA01]MCB9469539.1 ABC transporter permease [Candidatus Obscuribacterales bacterium]
MSFWELIQLALQGIVTNRLRSFLTILGITFGIAAVIALLAVGQGAREESNRQIRSLGSNILYLRAGAASTGHVSMGMGTSATLTMEDAESIRDMCPAVGDVAPGVEMPLQVQHEGQNVLTSIVATLPGYPRVRNYNVETGRFFNQADVEHNSRVCVLGSTVKENLFSEGQDPLGTKVLIAGELFEIIGTMEKKGAASFRDLDDVVIVPLTTAYNRLFGYKPSTGRSVAYILVQAKSEAEIVPAQFQITNLLRLRHKIKYPMVDDFYIRSQQDLLKTSQEMTGLFTVLLGATAGISLLVGGIGIMNIMLVSVTERTREIGIRKAIGAKTKDIMAQFVVEATVLSFSGGLFGIALGLLGAFGLSSVVHYKTVVTPWSIVLSFLVSILVGLFFGIYPAKRAAKMNPIDALRSE